MNDNSLLTIKNTIRTIRAKIPQLYIHLAYTLYFGLGESLMMLRLVYLYQSLASQVAPALNKLAKRAIYD